MKKLRSILKRDKNIGISVFFPCFNDEFSIQKLVENAFEVLKEVTYNYEVIVIDDGSTDNSKTILQELTKKYQNLKLIFHENNQGYGGALQSGFKNASKELIFYTDGDGQYDINELPLLLVLMTDDVNFINGIKMSRQDPTYRVVMGKLYSMLSRWLFWLPIEDVDCDFRLIRKKLIEKIHLSNTSGSVCVELVKKAQRQGAIFRQISVHHYERKWGSSQFFRPKRLLLTFFGFCDLWWTLMILDNFFKKHKYE